MKFALGSFGITRRQRDYMYTDDAFRSVDKDSIYLGWSSWCIVSRRVWCDTSVSQTKMGGKRRQIRKGLLLCFRTERDDEKRATFASVCRAARLQAMSPQVDIQGSPLLHKRNRIEQQHIDGQERQAGYWYHRGCWKYRKRRRRGVFASHRRRFTKLRTSSWVCQVRCSWLYGPEIEEDSTDILHVPWEVTKSH